MTAVPEVISKIQKIEILVSELKDHYQQLSKSAKSKNLGICSSIELLLNDLKLPESSEKKFQFITYKKKARKGDEFLGSPTRRVHSEGTRMDSELFLADFLSGNSNVTNNKQSLKVSSNSDGLLKFTKDVTKYDVKITNESKLVSMLCGPSEKEEEERYGNFASAYTISTYPRYHKRRCGDPICDRFYVRIHEKHTLFSLADGCNWGSKPREAAILACNEVVTYLSQHITTANNTLDIGSMLLKALMHAHTKIISTKVDCMDEVGTTTVLCGVITKIQDNNNNINNNNNNNVNNNSSNGGSIGGGTNNSVSSSEVKTNNPLYMTMNDISPESKSKKKNKMKFSEDMSYYGKNKAKCSSLRGGNSISTNNANSSSISNNSNNIAEAKGSPTTTIEKPKKRWVCICATVGDCKAFHYSRATHSFSEITTGNRINSVDAKDCGGRLGPIGDESRPDLRNLRLYSLEVDVGDIIFACSDGVHDNLDPQMLGMLPPEFGIQSETWEKAEAANSQSVHDVKAKFLLNQICDLTKEFTNSATSYSPHQITQSLIDHAFRLTKKTREYMENNPDLRQPTDLLEYPGKLDHTSCIALTIGKAPLHPIQSISDLVKSPIAVNKFQQYFNDGLINLSAVYPSITTEDLTFAINNDISTFHSSTTASESGNAIEVAQFFVKLLSNANQLSEGGVLLSKSATDQIFSALVSIVEPSLSEIRYRLEYLFKKFQSSDYMKFGCFEEL